MTVLGDARGFHIVGVLMTGNGVSVTELKTLYLTLNNGALADLPMIG